MNIKQIPFIYRVLDILLFPLMFLIAGFNKNDVQHTHGYHGMDFSNVILPKVGVVKTVGTDTSKHKNIGHFYSHWGFFHIPFLGGWKNYVVLENTDFDKFWFIGWKTEDFVQVNRLPLNRNMIF